MHRVIARIFNGEDLRQMGREHQQDSVTVELTGLPVKINDKVVGHVTGAWLEDGWILGLLEFDEDIRVG